MEPIEEIPDLPQSMDPDDLLVRRLRPDDQGRSGVQIMDVKYLTRIELRHGDGHSGMFEELISYEFAWWLLVALYDINFGGGR